MSYGLLFVVVVMCFGLIGMALVLMGEGSDPSEWLREDDALPRTDTAAALPFQPTLRSVTSDGSRYLDHHSDVHRVWSDEYRREFIERLEASTTARGSARLSARAADAPEVREL